MLLTKLKLIFGIILISGILVAVALTYTRHIIAADPAASKSPLPSEPTSNNQTGSAPKRPAVQAPNEELNKIGLAILKKLKARLDAETKELKPSPTFELTRGEFGGSLAMRYKMREYLIYPSINKTGRLGREPEKREGPDDDGVFLCINVLRKGEVLQPVTPQTIQEPYWSTRLELEPINGESLQFYTALSSRMKGNSDLVQRIQKSIKEVAKNKNPTEDR
jgi:hypothetical protein